MFWTEDKDDSQQFQVSDAVVDVVFSIQCKCIPRENAYLLSSALHQALPWLEEETNAGIHPVYGAESGNGWERPDTELLYLSRRQKLMVRLPKSRVAQSEVLVGQTLEIGGYPLKVGDYDIKKLSDLPTIFARNVVAGAQQSEEEFMGQALEQLQALGIRVQKMMCGKIGQIDTPGGLLHTRSLMLADLEREESVLLQEQGLGPERKLGCGLFLPQKGISAVKSGG